MDPSDLWNTFSQKVSGVVTQIQEFVETPFKNTQQLQQQPQPQPQPQSQSQAQLPPHSSHRRRQQSTPGTPRIPSLPIISSGATTTTTTTTPTVVDMSDEALARRLQEEERSELTRRRNEEEELSKNYIKQLIDGGQISVNPYQEEEEQISMEAQSRLSNARMSRASNETTTNTNITTNTTSTSTPRSPTRVPSADTYPGSASVDRDAQRRYTLSEEDAALLNLIDGCRTNPETRRRLYHLIIALRHYREVRYGGFDANSSKNPARNKEDLPVYVHKEKKDDADGDITCSICLSEYLTGEEIKIVPCLHKFHKACIDMWLDENNVCPVCKCQVD